MEVGELVMVEEEGVMLVVVVLGRSEGVRRSVIWNMYYHELMTMMSLANSMFLL